jgi:hypothetical protein
MKGLLDKEGGDTMKLSLCDFTGIGFCLIVCKIQMAMWVTRRDWRLHAYIQRKEW